MSADIRKLVSRPLHGLAIDVAPTPSSELLAYYRSSADADYAMPHL